MLAALASSLSLFASDIDRIRELNQQILTDVNSKSARRNASSDSALRERASLLNALITSDPLTARGLLPSPETLRDLRNRQADGMLLERTFAYKGPVESTVIDQPQKKRSLHSYLFESDGDSITAAAGLKALRVKRNAGGDDLWIEYRQPAGAFDTADAADLRHMFEGALIRAQSPAEALYSDLLDFTPASIDETRLLLFPGYFAILYCGPVPSGAIRIAILLSRSCR